MKKYLIICGSKEAANKVNDFIAVNSLFTEGETITEPVARWGNAYTDDDRVYNAVRAYIQEGGVSVQVFNIREFDVVKDNIEFYRDAEGHAQIRRLPPTVYRVNIDEDSITVEGYTMKVKIKREFIYKLMKTYVGISAPEDLAYFIQNEGSYHTPYPKLICEHVIAHGKKCV